MVRHECAEALGSIAKVMCSHVKGNLLLKVILVKSSDTFSATDKPIK